MIWSMRDFRMYLAHKPSVIWTDAESAKKIMDGEPKDGTGRLMRWALAAQNFD